MDLIKLNHYFESDYVDKVRESLNCFLTIDIDKLYQIDKVSIPQIPKGTDEDAKIFKSLFKKEIDDLRKKFPDLIAIHINRPNYDNGLTFEQKMHKTEIDLDDYDKFNEQVINTTLEELKQNAENIYTKYER